MFKIRKKTILATIIAAALLFTLVPLTATAATNAVNKSTVKIDKTKYIYTGKAIKPKITVKGLKLTNFSVTYKNNVKVGKAKAIVQGKGEYTGKVTKTFVIAPKAPSTLTAKLTSNKNATIKWSEVKAMTEFANRNKDWLLSAVYRVYMKKGSGTYKLLETLGATEVLKNGMNTYKVTDLAAGSKYTIKIVSYFTDYRTGKSYKGGYKTVSVTTVGKPGDLTVKKTNLSRANYDAAVTFTKATGATNYQIKTATDSGYSNSKSYYISSTEKTIDNLNLEDTRYFKVRGYKVVDGKKIYGSWTSSKKIEGVEVPSPYSYEVYYLQKPEKIYTNTSFPIYIKTDNPADFPNLIRVRVNGKGAASGVEYSDIDCSKELDEIPGLYRVDGGYVYMMSLRTDEDEHWDVGRVGENKVEIKEYNWKTEKTKTVYTFTINAIDYDKAESNYLDSLIAKYTTPDMDRFEKMEALGKAMKYKEFQYFHTNETDYIFYAAEAMEPYWVNKRIDSALAPRIMCKLAEKIGGFDDIHNCFMDYPRGSDGWIKYHAKCKVTKGSRTEYYSGCPLEGAYETFEMFDFSDMDRLYPVK